MHQMRRPSLIPLLLLGALACTPTDDPGEPSDTDAATDTDSSGGTDTEADYEIWALDQGLHQIHIFNAALDEIDTIDLSDIAEVPHMIDFSSDYRYAFIAATAGARTLVYRTADRERVATLETGAGSHMARVAPDDSVITVAAIGTSTIVEITPDWDEETFEISRSLFIEEDPKIIARADEFPATRPVCQEYTADSKKGWFTLGPGYADAGLVVLDLDTFTLDAVFPPDELGANCGSLRHPTDGRMFVNGGPANDDGFIWVMDPSDHSVLEELSSLGHDVHGFTFAKDASEFWVVNRATSNLVIYDADDYTLIDDIPDLFKSPDIFAMSPDGRRAFVTLRGPEPRSGPHAIAGDTPGFAVIDVETRTVIDLVEPAQGDDDSDFHGIGVRPL